MRESTKHCTSMSCETLTVRRARMFWYFPLYKAKQNSYSILRKKFDIIVSESEQNEQKYTVFFFFFTLK
jgi:hypothetical protein